MAWKRVITLSSNNEGVKIVDLSDIKEVPCMLHNVSYSETFTWWKLRKTVNKFFTSDAKENMKVLDAGCGMGTNIRMFNDVCPVAEKMSFYGIDISSSAILSAKEYCDKNKMNCFFVTGHIKCLPYKDEMFDIIVCSEVLEHLLNPKIVLEELYRVLKWGGGLYVTTPNRENIPRKIGGIKLREHIEKDCVKSDPFQNIDGPYGHISNLSSKELIQMVKNMGFKVEKIKKGSLIYGLPYFDRHQVLFGIILIIDAILDCLPGTYNLSWNMAFKLRK